MPRDTSWLRWRARMFQVLFCLSLVYLALDGDNYLRVIASDVAILGLYFTGRDAERA